MRKSMLKMLVIALSLSSLHLSAAPPAPKYPEKLADVILKMEKAADPENKSKDIKTRKTVMEATVPMTEIKLLLTNMVKRPNLFKSETTIPGVMTEVTVFNGQEAWKSSPHMGITEITGKALNFMKFSALLETSPHFADCYEKIELADKTEKINDVECLKLTCHPPAEYGLKPQIYYVDKNTYLILRLDWTLVTEMGETATTTLLLNYKKVDGIMIPEIISMLMMGMQIDAKTISIQFNPDIPDTEFARPAETGPTTNAVTNSAPSVPATVKAEPKP